jgi:hypothetical protein
MAGESTPEKSPQCPLAHRTTTGVNSTTKGAPRLRFPLERRHPMSTCTKRYIFTALIYAGVLIFLWPYFTGHISTGIIFLVVGIGIAVVAGILRCYYTEGDCTEPVPNPPTTHHTTIQR